MSGPQLVAIVPSEDLLQSVVEADRRFTLHRVVYDLYARAFPARMGSLVINLIFCGGAGEHQGQLALYSPSGAALSITPFTFTARTFHLQAVALAGVELPEPGNYALSVEVDGQPALSAPLAVVSLKTDGGGAP